MKPTIQTLILLLVFVVIASGIFTSPGQTISGSGGNNTSTHFLTLQPPSNASSVRVMTYNIEHGGDGDAYQDLNVSTNPGFISVVVTESPDVVLFVETEEWDDNDDSIFEEVLGAINDAVISKGELPYEGYTEQDVSGIGSGVAILSRFPLTDVKFFSALTLDNGNAYIASHRFVDATVNLGEVEMHVIGAHLKAMTGDTNEEKRERQVEGLINYMDNLGDVPIFLMGDFNSFSPEDIGLNNQQSGLGYGPVTMLVDPSDPVYGQYSSDVHTFTDVYRSLNPSYWGVTMDDYDSRIDFIFGNQHFPHLLQSSVVNGSTTVPQSLADSSSDHYAVTCDISIEGAGNTIPRVIETTHTTAKVLYGSANQSFGYVEYSQTQGIPYELSTTTEVVQTSHTVLLEDLSPGMTYYYRVAYLNGTSMSAEYSFQTRNLDIVINEIYYDGGETLTYSSEVEGNDGGFNHLIFTEVYYDTLGDESTEEWVELYNPTGQAIALSGWSITDNIGTYQLAGTISPGQYWVAARSSSAFNTLYGFNPDKGDLKLALGNSGDILTLKNGGSVIDQVGWEGEDGWSMSASGGQTLYRSDLTDDSNDGSDWSTQTHTSNPRSGAFVHGDVGSGTLERDEYVVLYNPTASTVDLSGWYLGSSTGLTRFPSDTSVVSSGYLTIAHDADSYQSRFGELPDLEWNATWRNDSTNNPNVDDLTHVSGTMNLSNIGDFVFLDKDRTDGVSNDIVVWGTAPSFGSLPEKNYIGTVVELASGDEALVRVQLGEEGEETAENAEQLGKTFTTKNLIFSSQTAVSSTSQEETSTEESTQTSKTTSLDLSMLFALAVMLGVIRMGRKRKE